MGYEQIQNFIVAPDLPDIIIGLLYLILLISICFLKAFVKRDNKNTLFHINTKKSEIDEKEKELIECKNQLIEERKRFEKKEKKWESELKNLKKAVLESSGNTRELVAKGTAKEIATLLSDDKSNESEEKSNE